MNCIEQKFNLKKHSFTKQYKKERDEQFSQFLFEIRDKFYFDYLGQKYFKQLIVAVIIVEITQFIFYLNRD